MSATRVLMTTDTVGGVWTYAVELARGLAAWDIEILLATAGAPLSDGQRRQLDGLENVALAESSYRLEWMPAPWEDVAAAGRWLLDLAADFRPDVVHLNDYSHAALDWPCPVLVVGHSCVLSWHEAVRGEPAGAEWGEYRRRVTNGLRAADRVVTPTAAMLAALERHYGPLPPSQVIANGIESPDAVDVRSGWQGQTEGMAPRSHALDVVSSTQTDSLAVGSAANTFSASDPTAKLSVWGKSGPGVGARRAIRSAPDPASQIQPATQVQKEEFVFAAGRWWDEGKNIAALGQVAGALPWPIRVAGLPNPDGSDAAPPAALEFLGCLDAEQMHATYARAAIYSLPARYEPFGLTPLEAAFHGCALVLGDIPTLREVWGEAACFAPPDDTTALAAALRELIESPQLRVATAVRCRQRARRYTAERMAQAYAALYGLLTAPAASSTAALTVQHTSAR